jgi:type I pantothenate kinase
MPFTTYRREEWSRLPRGAAPSVVIDLVPASEVSDIYLPLGELLRWHESAVPFVIGVSGSVAVGKSTFCRTLQAVLRAWPQAPKVEIVSTDGFLLPNRELETRGIMHRKGFPESYDLEEMKRFFSELRVGAMAQVPLYSHETYDRLPYAQTIEAPDIMIFEGVAATLPSEEVDFSIYLDAEEADIEAWFLSRVLALREQAEPDTFYWQFREITEEAFAERARKVWRDVNLANLHEHILPTREHADLVLHKGADHSVTYVQVKAERTVPTNRKIEEATPDPSPLG